MAQLVVREVRLDVTAWEMKGGYGADARGQRSAVGAEDWGRRGWVFAMRCQKQVIR